MYNKRMVVSLALALFILAAVAVDAFAAFEEIHMVGSEGSVVSKGIFGWDETPWLYLKLPSDVCRYNVTDSWWQDPVGGYFFEGSDPSINPVQWLSLSSWNTVKKLGNWNVNAVYFYSGGKTGTGSTGFAVTPEPVSTILFLTGGTILVARRLRRKK